MIELDNQIKLGHLLLDDRECRVCGEIKNLIEGFYQTRKNRGPVASSFSYECKICTVRRIVSNRKRKRYEDGIKSGDFYEEPVGYDYRYPDW